METNQLLINYYKKEEIKKQNKEDKRVTHQKKL